MIKPIIPNNEKSRINELSSFNILDTLPEKDYDEITKLASNICQTNIALISLVDTDRQWFKSKVGLEAPQTPREYAFCAHAINKPDDILIVEDTHEDIRFHDNPLVTDAPFLKFYAGAPLVTKNGLALGTLCVLDNQPKQLTEKQLESLKALSHQVINLLEARRNNLILKEKITLLKEQNQNLQGFAHHAAHDLKSPLNTIDGFIEMFLAKHAKDISESGTEIIGKIKKSSGKLKSLIDGLLHHSSLEDINLREKETICTKEVLKQIKLLFSANEDTQFFLNSKKDEIEMNRTVLDKILFNLVSNAVKYSDKETTIVSINIIEDNSHYLFTITDNGSGIPHEKLDKIFNMFEIATGKDKFGHRGNGIGLASVKKLVEKLNGTISVKSKLQEGSTFSFSIKK